MMMYATGQPSYCVQRCTEQPCRAVLLPVQLVEAYGSALRLGLPEHVVP